MGFIDVSASALNTNTQEHFRYLCQGLPKSVGRGNIYTTPTSAAAAAMKWGKGRGGGGGGRNDVSHGPFT